MVSADAPLAVHSLHTGRHHQRHYGGTGEVQQQAGSIGGGHTCLAPGHRPVFVRPTVRQQVAGIGRPRMKLYRMGLAFGRQVASNASGVIGSYRQLFNVGSRKILRQNR